MVADHSQDSRPLRVRGFMKSSRSEQGRYCVEIASDGQRVHMRDSKNPSGAVLSFGAAAWRGFVAEVKVGGFDCE